MVRFKTKAEEGFCRCGDFLQILPGVKKVLAFNDWLQKDNLTGLLHVPVASNRWHQNYLPRLYVQVTQVPSLLIPRAVLSGHLATVSLITVLIASFQNITENDSCGSVH